MDNEAEPITGREYKLLLNPRKFDSAPSNALAAAFWARKLRPVITEGLDARSDGGSRAEGELKLNPEKQRVVRFFDTGDRLLNRNGFALRSRMPTQDGEPDGAAEVTLKFRTADLLLAAELAEKVRPLTFDKKKFEEDVAPLQITTEEGAGKKVVRTKSYRSYSRFSVSLYRQLDRPKTLGDAFDGFQAFERELRAAEAGKVKGSAPLYSGPTICEWVFDAARVDLGKVDADFGLTLWYFVKGGTHRNPCRRASSGELAPKVAEISFALDTKKGRVDADVSRRAMRLFTAMQEQLAVDRSATSKTVLALPPLR